MQEKPDRRDTLKLAGAATVAAVLAAGSTSASEPPTKSKITLPDELAERLTARAGWHQGPVYYVCGNSDYNFVFGIIEKGEGKPFGIDTTGKYGEFAVRVVLLAYEKGLQVSVYEDPGKLGWARSVIA